MDLAQAFENQKVEGITEKPEQIIDTFLAKVFLYPDKVYKVYKHNKNFTGDFSDFNFRKDFYTKDFTWNNTMSPRIYLALKSVKFKDGYYINANNENAEDFYIEMKRIDNSKTLTNLLLRDEITKKDVKNIANELIAKSLKLTEKIKPESKQFFEKPYIDIYIESFKDIGRFAYSAKDYISKEETDRIINTTINYIKNIEYFKNFSKSNFTVSCDCHSDNILILNGKVVFIDIFLINPSHYVKDFLCTLSRAALDVEVLKDKEHADIMYEVYRQYAPQCPEKIRTIYYMYNGLIKTALYYSTNNPTLAKKYHEYIREKVKELA